MRSRTACTLAEWVVFPKKNVQSYWMSRLRTPLNDAQQEGLSTRLPLFLLVSSPSRNFGKQINDNRKDLTETI